MNNTPPSIAFELGVGEFRIVTPEAVYQIKVCPNLVEATQAGEAAQTQGADLGSAAGQPFFQELSQELFDKVGRLARQLSLSVEELPGEMSADALGDTDQQLESAKGQLEEVIDLTEKASMSIMDSADEIQSHLTRLGDQLGALRGLNFLAQGEDAPSPDLPRPDSGAPLLEKLAEINGLLDSLLAPAPDEAPPPEAPPPAPEPQAAPPEAPAGENLSVLHFEADVVFQTLYELCTNESVKDHIRLMREALAGDFDGQGISDKLAEMSATVEVEDGFYNFPIPAILKTIYGATSSEEFRTVLKKMNQTAASIFLDNVLPIEAETMEIEVPGTQPPAPAMAAAAPPAPADSTPQDLSPQDSIPSGPAQDGLLTLRALTAELEDMVRSGAGEGEAGACTPALTRDRDTVVQAVSQGDDLMQKISRHLTRILETLAFQDLSGQRIKRVVGLMGDIQTQLLSILVSVDTKLKVHQAGQDQAHDPQKTEKMAQDEVDKALEKLMADSPSELMGPGAEHRLNQNAVNDLLAQLGF